MAPGGLVALEHVHFDAQLGLLIAGAQGGPRAAASRSEARGEFEMARSVAGVQFGVLRPFGLHVYDASSGREDEDGVIRQNPPPVGPVKPPPPTGPARGPSRWIHITPNRPPQQDD